MAIVALIRIGTAVITTVFSVEPGVSSTPLTSRRQRLTSVFLYSRKMKPTNSSAASAPTPVPIVAPAAPYAGAVIWLPAASFSSPRLNRIWAAAMLTPTWMICSRICETAVGTMVPWPWKKPRSTPSMPMINTVGASSLTASTARGMLSTVPARNPAPKYMSAAAASPRAAPKAMLTASTCHTLRYCFRLSLADTILETAMGRL